MKNKITQSKAFSLPAIAFLTIIFLTPIIFVLTPKSGISLSERRHLVAFPTLAADTIQTKTFMDDTESYLLDHFPRREVFRRLKALYAYNILHQNENNSIYITQNSAIKLEYPLNENSVLNTAKKLTALKAQYFPDTKAYYSIIPDKNYFTAAQNRYPSIDYPKMTLLLRENLSENDYRYIDIFDTLTLDDYYRTDTHWRQEAIFPTAKKIVEALGVAEYLPTNKSAYEIQTIPDFYGVYYGQAALPMNPDTITLFTDEAISSAMVWNLESNTTTQVYDLSKLTDAKSVDKYDIFLGGAQALQIIKSPKAATDRRLIIFRDSYAGSLAPLLLDAYSEITLIDLRYISSSLLGNYVDFEDADILFLYNTILINNSAMLK